MSLHTNSMTAYPEVDRFNRRAQIMDAYRANQQPLTDRQVMRLLGYTDLNAVRPRITELIEDGHLEEAGSVRDEATGRMVRKVRLVFKTAMFTMLLVIAALANARAQGIPANVAVAMSEIGKGEIGRDNCGPNIKRYLGGRERLPWCAGFVSYCLKKAGYKTNYTLQARAFLNMGKRVSQPRPGDIAVFSRVNGGHVGIVKEVTKTEILTIEGNVGDFPARVKEIRYKKNDMKNLLGFVRIQKG